MALLTSAPALSAAEPDGERADPALVRRLRRSRDVRFAELITDAKGDRTLSPSKQDDPDLYVRVVDRDRSGVVIRGAKFHITAGPIVHELVVLPTKRMREGEEAYAIACAVPAECPRGDADHQQPPPAPGHVRDRPVSRAVAIPDSMVVFDDVLVPYERVFLDGDVEHRPCSRIRSASGSD